MKTYLLLFVILTMGFQCRKHPKPVVTDIPGLPPATQTGANTLGFLLNGQPWTPEGPNNLSIDYDPGFNNGIVGIIAYRKILSQDNSIFSFGIQDSLNFMTFPKTIAVRLKAMAQFSYSDKNYCDRNQYDTNVLRSGLLTINVLDKTKRIFAGTFSITLFNPSCGDTIKITNGRFDMKF